MRPEDFQLVATLVRERSGLVLTPDKAYLLESRLMPLARKRGYKGLDDLVAQLRRRDGELALEITEAMTTNESFFFRDGKPFEQFEQIILPNLIKTRSAKRGFRIWCAAASSGQEPYSLAMILKEHEARLSGWRPEILGTDIAREVLGKAKAGIYTQFEVQRGLPVQKLVKYFTKEQDYWVIDAKIRAMVQFREWNLLQDYRQLGQFDVVYCRNVLIYFDTPTKARVLDRIAAQMPDDGVLFLGGAETVLGVTNRFKPIPDMRGAYAVARGDGASLGRKG